MPPAASASAAKEASPVVHLTSTEAATTHSAPITPTQAATTEPTRAAATTTSPHTTDAAETAAADHTTSSGTTANNHQTGTNSTFTQNAQTTLAFATSSNALANSISSSSPSLAASSSAASSGSSSTPIIIGATVAILAITAGVIGFFINKKTKQRRLEEEYKTMANLTPVIPNNANVLSPDPVYTPKPSSPVRAQPPPGQYNDPYAQPYSPGGGGYPPQGPPAQYGGYNGGY